VNQARGEGKTKTPQPPPATGEERAGRPRFPRRRRGRGSRWGASCLGMAAGFGGARASAAGRRAHAGM